MISVVQALASSQYTSRILRKFMRSRVTQVVLGTFAGIFTYCLIVLRTIRGGDEGAFVPSLAVFFGFVMAIGGQRMAAKDMEATTKNRYDPKFNTGGTFGVKMLREYPV